MYKEENILHRLMPSLANTAVGFIKGLSHKFCCFNTQDHVKLSIKKWPDDQRKYTVNEVIFMEKFSTMCKTAQNNVTRSCVTYRCKFLKLRPKLIPGAYVF